MEEERLIKLEERIVDIEEELKDLLISNQNYLKSILLGLDKIEDRVYGILFKQI